MPRNLFCFCMDKVAIKEINEDPSVAEQRNSRLDSMTTIKQ